MRFIDDLPFYIVIIAVFLNILFGIVMKTDFFVLSIRSIIVTVVFTALGFFLSRTLKSTVRAVNKADEEKKRPSFDVKVPATDEEEILQYQRERDEDEFEEMNPAEMKDKV